ncbi:hypothetical protein AZI86_18890 [Bdellovibrio bacteriovorus]|uniref:Outer membrane protein beta-barrel domain-containing protein n=1 Tax=Bdellovibrio bacteriovorus TaxID=959 RepID=A0A150WDL9_BDEBC|nr:hypothetical protein [Bdellovibrio bacteriovorus]KYG60980.1 hypothetical protein AZI86_18890 [Bdellovibrio bacteriovorus]
MMKLKMILVVCSVLGVTNSFAQTPALEAQYKIRQIILSKNIVVVTSNSSEPIERGKILLATFQDNTQCPLKVVGQSANNITLDTSDCDKAKSLTLNQMLEPSLHVIDEPVLEKQPKNKNASVSENVPLILPNRTMTDLGYLLQSGKFGIEGAFFSQNEELSYYSGSTFAADQKTRRTNLGLIFSYGITDNFNASIRLILVPGENTELSSLNTTYYSKGFKDPKASLIYRPVQQTETAPLDVVLTAYYIPKTFEAKIATDNADGTMGSGRNSAGLQLGTFRRFRAAEIGILIDYTSLWAGSTTDAENGEITEKGAGETIEVQGQVQFKVNDGFFISGGLGFASLSSTEAKNTTTTTLTRTSAYTMSGVQVGARFALIPDTSSLDFFLQSVTASNSDVTQGTAKLTLKDMRRTTIGASVKYLF